MKLETKKTNILHVLCFKFHERGQSLIETIVAIFVLTTGLSAGLALAIFAFGSSTEVAEQITATGLAREGLEVVRRMRDSNWLADSLRSCSDIGQDQQCYRDWMDETYDIRGSGNGREYRLLFDPIANNNKWTLQRASGNPDYQLYEQSSGGLNHTASGNPTNMFRKITIVRDDSSPPYSGSSPLLLVRSAVWWHGKRCPAITDLTNPNQTNCKVISEEYLTNWKNY